MSGVSVFIATIEVTPVVTERKCPALEPGIFICLLPNSRGLRPGSSRRPRRRRRHARAMRKRRGSYKTLRH
jgi:hypothetical protein